MPRKTKSPVVEPELEIDGKLAVVPPPDTRGQCRWNWGGAAIVPNELRGGVAVATVDRCPGRMERGSDWCDAHKCRDCAQAAVRDGRCVGCYGRAFRGGTL